MHSTLLLLRPTNYHIGSSCLDHKQSASYWQPVHCNLELCRLLVVVSMIWLSGTQHVGHLPAHGR